MDNDQYQPSQSSLFVASVIQGRLNWYCGIRGWINGTLHAGKVKWDKHDKDRQEQYESVAKELKQ